MVNLVLRQVTRKCKRIYTQTDEELQNPDWHLGRILGSFEANLYNETKPMSVALFVLVLELAGNLLAELLAEIPTALLAEIFLLLAENSRNFEPFLMLFTQILSKISSKLFLFQRKHDF